MWFGQLHDHVSKEGQLSCKAYCIFSTYKFIFKNGSLSTGWFEKEVGAVGTPADVGQLQVTVSIRATESRTGSNCTLILQPHLDVTHCYHVKGVDQHGSPHICPGKIAGTDVRRLIDGPASLPLIAWWQLQCSGSALATAMPPASRQHRIGLLFMLTWITALIFSWLIYWFNLKIPGHNLFGNLSLFLFESKKKTMLSAPKHLY